MLTYVSDLSIIFLSIILEAFPFILFGVFISAIVEEFVSPDFFARIIPKNPILGAFTGVIMGFFVPACDCAVIPISKRLIKKGVPINVAISFMLASPIINPVVIISTVYAFGSIVPKMILMRTVLGVCLAIIIGFIVGKGKDRTDVLKKEKMKDILGDQECSCHHHHEHKGEDITFFGHIYNIIVHAKDEFWDISKYLIVGSLIASSMQVFIPRDVLTIVSGNNILSIVSLMLFAYLVSLCSTSDSFVAKTFTNQFNNSSILAFLLLGPMIDVKNTIVLLGNYKKEFVFKLILIIFAFVFISSILIGM